MKHKTQLSLKILFILFDNFVFFFNSVIVICCYSLNKIFYYFFKFYIVLQTTRFNNLKANFQITKHNFFETNYIIVLDFLIIRFGLNLFLISDIQSLVFSFRNYRLFSIQKDFFVKSCCLKNNTEFEKIYFIKLNKNRLQ